MIEEITSGFNPHAGMVLPSMKISDRMSLCSIPVNMLFKLTPDPRDAEDKKRTIKSAELQELSELRDDVQRLFENQKKQNVPSYAGYICELHEGADGITPPIILYSENELAHDYNEQGFGFLLVPYDKPLIAIDGETQLAARYEARLQMPETGQEKVALLIAHGFPKKWARQCFHDLNVFGVKPNAALGIGMDSRDPLTQVAREVENSVPFLKDRVNKSRRQIRVNDKDVMTITTLRGACITLAEGISGVKYGAKRVHISEDRLPRINEVAKEWMYALTDAFGPAIEDREKKLTSAPAVFAALGAVGHVLVNIDDRDERRRKVLELIEGLRDVDWRRARHWEGIAGKFTPKGVFSISGSKDTSYAIYDALADHSSPAYQIIRNAHTAVAAA